MKTVKLEENVLTRVFCSYTFQPERLAGPLARNSIQSLEGEDSSEAISLIRTGDWAKAALVKARVRAVKKIRFMRSPFIKKIIGDRELSGNQGIMSNYAGK